MKAFVKQTCTLVCGEGSIVELSPKQYELAKANLSTADENVQIPIGKSDGDIEKAVVAAKEETTKAMNDVFMTEKEELQKAIDEARDQLEAEQAKNKVLESQLAQSKEPKITKPKQKKE